MSSQPSKAHFDAVDIVENHARKALDAEIKRIVEKPDLYLSEGKNVETGMIEAI